MTKTTRRRPLALAQPSTSQPAPIPPQDPVRRSDERRSALRRLLAKHRMSPADLARRLRSPNANFLYNFLNGRSFSLSQDSLDRIGVAFPDDPLDDFLRPATATPVVCTAVAEAPPDRTQGSFALPPALQTPLPLPIGVGEGDAGQFGVVIGDAGVAGIYPVGTILLCRPLDGAGEDLPSGCRVVVQRPLGDGIEVSVRELVVDPASARSSAFNVRELRCVRTGPASQDDHLVIAGVVIASWQLEPSRSLE